MVIDLLEFLCSCEKCFDSTRQQGAEKLAWKTIWNLICNSSSSSPHVNNSFVQWYTWVGIPKC